MIAINYPAPEFRIENREGKEFIFDHIRRRWVVLTDEEWVRQNFIQYLVCELKFPSSMIAIEKEIQLGELKKRFDILVYDKNHQPWMLIECKAGEVKLDDAVVRQLLIYHQAVHTHYLVITNGKYTFGWKKSGGELAEIDFIPQWR